MSPFPCAGCGQQARGRLAAIYSAWYLADGSRTAWKQRLCAPCVMQRLRQLLLHAQDSTSAVTSCPACGIESSQDLDPIYMTLYLPKQESREYALTTDATCAARLRLLLQDGAQRLPDRNGGSGGGFNRGADDDPFAGVLA